jgi:hypothetical protein
MTIYSIELMSGKSPACMMNTQIYLLDGDYKLEFS